MVPKRHKNQRYADTLLLTIALIVGAASCSDVDEADPYPISGPPCASRPFPPYVRSVHGPTGGDAYWPASVIAGCIPIAWNPAGTEDIEGDGEREAMWNAIRSWSWVAAECGSAFCFKDAGEVSPAEGLGYDQSGVNFNYVTFSNDVSRWPEARSKVIAATTISTLSHNGEIVDADIVFNNVHHTFGAVTPPVHSLADVESVMVHELGHVLGLGHTEDETSVMMESERQGEMRRDPGPADRAGVCDFFLCYE